MLAELNLLLLQGDHGGQRLCLTDFTFDIPQSCPTALPDYHVLPRQNWADSGTSKVKSTKLSP